MDNLFIYMAGGRLFMHLCMMEIVLICYSYTVWAVCISVCFINSNHGSVMVHILNNHT